MISVIFFIFNYNLLCLLSLFLQINHSKYHCKAGERVCNRNCTINRKMIEIANMAKCNIEIAKLQLFEKEICDKAAK